MTVAYLIYANPLVRLLIWAATFAIVCLWFSVSFLWLCSPHNCRTSANKWPSYFPFFGSWRYIKDSIHVSGACVNICAAEMLLYFLRLHFLPFSPIILNVVSPASFVFVLPRSVPLCLFLSNTNHVLTEPERSSRNNVQQSSTTFTNLYKLLSNEKKDVDVWLSLLVHICSMLFFATSHHRICLAPAIDVSIIFRNCHTLPLWVEFFWIY